MTQRETSAEINETAAGWAARIDGAQLDDGAQAQLDDWLAGDPRRLGAYARARALFVHSGRLKAFGDDFDPDAYFLESPEAAPSEALDDRAEETAMRRRRFLAAGGAAIAAATAGILGFSLEAAARTYKTGRGEIRLVPLKDGSSMTLNTSSTARISFTDEQRHVELIEGEAIFDVARDAERPFVVKAGDTHVRAVGTSFTVRRLTQEPVQILVRQGTVEVNRTGAHKGSVQRLSANMRAVASPTAPMIFTTTVAPTELMLELAWREGMLAFEDAPLQQAADQFARYSEMHIAFAEPAIGRETVTGLFAANDPAGFARSVALGLDLKADISGGTIVLRR